MWAASDKLANAYTTGEGLGWHEHDPRLFTAVGRFYGTMYRNSMLSERFCAVDGLIEQLQTGIRVSTSAAVWACRPSFWRRRFRTPRSSTSTTTMTGDIRETVSADHSFCGMCRQ